jgi:hypothetical protein
VRLIDDSSANNSPSFSLDAVTIRVVYGAGRGPCDWAETQAEAAQAAGIEIFTIGYGLYDPNAQPPNAICSYDGGASPYEPPTFATHLLADMAMGPIPQIGFYDDGGQNFHHAGCTNQTDIDGENADSDRFLCEARGTDTLAPVFRAAAEALAGGSRLIKFPPGIS